MSSSRHVLIFPLAILVLLDRSFSMSIHHGRLLRHRASKASSFQPCVSPRLAVKPTLTAYNASQTAIVTPSPRRRHTVTSQQSWFHGCLGMTQLHFRGIPAISLCHADTVVSKPYFTPVVNLRHTLSVASVAPLQSLLQTCSEAVLLFLSTFSQSYWYFLSFLKGSLRRKRRRPACKQNKCLSVSHATFTT